jgi:hypothetical protein
MNKTKKRAIKFKELYHYKENELHQEGDELLQEER